MIIIISGNLPSVKDAFALAIEESASYPEPDIQGEIPDKKPGHLSRLTVYKCDPCKELPRWVLLRDDVIYLHAKAFVNSFYPALKKIHP
jgi:hypothetical protein